MGFIRDTTLYHAAACVNQSNEDRAKELGAKPPRIPVSQIGHCPRQAILEAVRYHPNHPLHTDITHPFDTYVMEVLQAGNVWEPETGKALSRRLGDRVHWERGDPELLVGDDIWSGHIDFLVEPCEEYPIGAVIEHKATNPWNFSAKNRLPYPFHCMQVLMYERLARRKFGLPDPMPVWLYYRSWNNWAELMVWDEDDAIVWEGTINNSFKSGVIEESLDERIRLLEEYWKAQELPPRYETPIAEPFTCARAKNGTGRPSCKYFGYCWPDMAQFETFSTEEFKS